MKNQLWSIFIGLAFIIGVYIAAQAVIHRNKDEQTIHVKGMSQRNFTSDLIVWEGSFSRVDFDLKTAYRQIAHDRKIVEKYLLDKGIKPDQIIFGAVDVSKQYNSYYDENNNYHRVFDGYQLTQQVKIMSKEVEKVEQISREISELIDKGIYFLSQSPKYYYTQLSKLKLEMIAEATKNARLRAENIAKNSGAKLGKLKQAYLGVFQITGQYSDEDFTWGGTFNTSSKYKTATVTLTADFEIK